MRDEIWELRKKLHQFPELSGDEVETAHRIKSFILNHHPTQIIDHIAGHGLAAVYRFSSEGPCVAIRCELDALPIDERNQFQHKSTHPGISHKCGHDGHMAIVSGLIFWIKEQSFDRGTIILLFQPSEENGQGAQKVMEDPRIDDLHIDYVFALHNVPGEPSNKILVMDKGFSAEVQSFALFLHGKESHASEPENGCNPAQAMAEMILEIAKLNISDTRHEKFSILTPVHITMGQKSYGISPADGQMHYTIRTWDQSNMMRLKADLNKIFETHSQKYKLEYKVNWFEYFPASENSDICNHVIVKSAIEKGLDITYKPYPFKFGEDFGWFSKKYESAMFGLGAGINTPPLHHAVYDFPDEITNTGIEMFAGIISNILSR
ncbi:MAG: amidohydrolase [Saprospiraceae bacterium]